MVKYAYIQAYTCLKVGIRLELLAELAHLVALDLQQRWIGEGV